MGSLMQDDDNLFQNSISYLHNISRLKFNPPALKCLYLTKARLMELRKNIQVPSNMTRTTVRCQRCFLNLKDGPASYRIKAEEKKSKFARRMLSKNYQGKPMTRYQRKYLKKLDRFNGNRLAITCKFCKKETLIKLEKPKKSINSKAIKISLKKKKKIKKKDKFCGLNQEAVLSLTPKNTKSFVTSNFIPLKKSKKLTTVKLSKRKTVKEIVQEVVPKLSIRESQNKLKKKNRLKEFLNTSSSNKSSPTVNLKHFLQTL